MTFFRSIIISLITLPVAAVASAQNDAGVILRELNNKLSKAKDYTVSANIKVDIPLIRMLPVDVQIYYKQKGKFRVKSESIAIVPRQGFDQINMMVADTNAYVAMVQGEELMGDVNTKIVNIIPLTDTGEVIFAKFWVDPLQDVVIKSQFTTRNSGTIVTEYTYGSQLAYGLPDKMVFSIDTKKFKLPKNFSPQGTAPAEPAEADKKKNKDKGMIYITLTNYQVNKGIPDSVFEE